MRNKLIFLIKVMKFLIWVPCKIVRLIWI